MTTTTWIDISVPIHTGMVHMARFGGKLGQLRKQDLKGDLRLGMGVLGQVHVGKTISAQRWITR